MIVLIAFAFLAGIVTVLSPCILPILPIILTSSIGGSSDLIPEKRSSHSRPIGVVIGFILSFTFFTLFLSTIVRLSGVSADTLRLFSVLVIGGFGLSLLIPQFQVIVERMFSGLARFMPHSYGKSGFSGGLLIGLSVGLLWTPCVGPILASVISLAITGTVTFDAFLITLAYAIGTAIPMFLIMLGGQNALRKVPWLTANLGTIQKIFGIIMIITAIGIFLNIDRKVQTFVLKTFPSYGVGLTKLEDNASVKKELQGVNNKSIDSTDISRPTSDMNLPKGPTAPELIAGGVWFNSEPLALGQLKGKVVVIDFWTYSCINCQRTLPYLKMWNEKYKDKGLVIIGVHAPEFEFEKSEKNVKQAIKDFGLEYPIMQDNDFATWRAYDNHYWPAKYIVDKDGFIRYTHFGEGEYDVTEEVIQKLLREAGKNITSQIVNEAEQMPKGQLSPETYLGSKRTEFYYPNGTLEKGFKQYSLNEDIPDDSFSLGGKWMIDEEYASADKDAILTYNFLGDKVFLVLRPGSGTNGTCSPGVACSNPRQIKVFIDGAQISTKDSGKDVINGVVNVDSDRLYELVNLKGNSSRHMLRLEFEPGIQAFAFTFG